MPKKQAAIEDTQQLLISKIFAKLETAPNQTKSISASENIQRIQPDQIIGLISQFYVDYYAADDNYVKDLNKYRFDFMRSRAAHKFEKKLDQMIGQFVSELKTCLNVKHLSEIHKALLCIGCIGFEQEHLLMAIDNPTNIKLELIHTTINTLINSGLEGSSILLEIILKNAQLDRFVVMYFASKIIPLLGNSNTVGALPKEAYQSIFDRYLIVDEFDPVCRTESEFEMLIQVAINLFKLQQAEEQLESFDEFKALYKRIPARVVTLKLADIYKQMAEFVKLYGEHKPVCTMQDIQMKNKVSLKPIDNPIDDILKVEEIDIKSGQTLLCVEQKLEASGESAMVYEFTNPLDAQLYSLYCIVCKPNDVHAWFLSKHKLDHVEEQKPATNPVAIVAEQKPEAQQPRAKAAPVKKTMLAQFKSFAGRHAVPLAAATVVAGGAILAVNNPNMVPKLF